MPLLCDGLRAAPILFLLALGPAAAASPSDRPGDYAQLIPLSISGKHAVVRLALPRAVYVGARSHDLRDLRLFDAAGTPLPFALIEQVRETQESRSSAPVSIFPVRGQSGNSRLPNGLEIRTGSDGAVISVTASSRPSPGDTLVSLVLDMQSASRTATPVAALALTLPPGMTNYNAELALDVSDDLQDWEELAVASVSWLVNSQGASVQKNRIAFAPRAFRFARLRWIEGTPVEFAAVSAELVARHRTQERWESLVIQPSAGTPETDLVYAAPIGLPVTSLGLALQGQNIVMPVLVGQYRKTLDNAPGSTASVRLHPVVKTTFFQLTQNGQRRVSGDVPVPLTHATQWVVRPQTALPERPGLRLRWKPASIVFVAGGRPPYTLAFGRDGVKSSQVPIGQVAPGFSMQELAMLEQAKPSGPVLQHAIGPGASAADKASTRVFWLWGLLVAGVAVLAFMAWSLSRQMKNGSTEQPPG